MSLLQGTERAVVPAGGDALGVEPVDLLVEGRARAHVLERRGPRGRVGRRSRHAVEERGGGVAVDVVQRAESAVRPAGEQALRARPGDLLVEGRGRGDVLVGGDLGRGVGSIYFCIEIFI